MASINKEGHFIIFSLFNIRILDRQRNQKVLHIIFYQEFSIYLRYIMVVGDSQNPIAPHSIIRETCPDHSEEQ